MTDEMKRTVKVFFFMVILLVLGLSLVSGLVGLVVGWLTDSAFVGWVTTIVVAVALPVVFFCLWVWETWGADWWNLNRDHWALQTLSGIVGMIITTVLIVQIALLMYFLS